MEKRKKNKLVNIIKVVFAVLAVVTLLCSTAINVFASAGYSVDDEYIYAGNVDYTISAYLEIDDFSTEDPADKVYPVISVGVSPLFSNSMLDNAFISEDMSFSSPDDSWYIYSYIDNYEATDGFIGANPANGNIWECQIRHTSYLSQNYYFRYIHVEARDFYYYAHAGEYENLFSPFTGIIAESVLYLQSDDSYGVGAMGTIYYSEAGKENNADNRLIYEYVIGSDETAFIYESGQPYHFSVLPTDGTFDGKYTEPQLIYIEYLSLIVPVDEEIAEIQFGSIYQNLYYNFRNDDIAAFEPPVTPIDPGIFADYTSWIGTAVSGFLDFQIVQGFTLGGIVMVLIAFTLCLWFLKVFAGG